MFSETRSRSVVGAAVLSSCFTIARKSLNAGGHKGSLKTSVLLFNKLFLKLLLIISLKKTAASQQQFLLY